ncbi:MAG: GHMP kinase [Chitinophagales bacterium]|nr:hypothetical protein [Chitinophagales bacterium]MCB9018741.1 GHMP kinase [Chitinophagales bacterium]MCB9020968.1 GHMP kinase [Chitinophagales bacterium]HPE97982.1 GYDIA family GHMP kinase [Chitinophagales bacterium]HRX24119.1 GYDIA family GHMP kinase [Chitinophagales bacterium]
MHFHANGKLLISGEYLVLDGALALAVPTRFGQNLQVTEGKDGGSLHWRSTDRDGNVWLEEHIQPDDLRKSIDDADTHLIKVLKKAVKLQPGFADEIVGKQAIATLGFPDNWGLGSSSTLVSLIAQWSGADALRINKKVFGSSGYDIACAQSWMPILFRIDEEGPVWDSVHFLPPQPEHFCFVHLNQKQNSRDAIAAFRSGKNKFEKESHIISEISEALLFCDDFADFLTLLDEHEEVMQFVLQEERVQTARFQKFNGVVKSLGAWGGDFVLAGSDMPPAEMHQWFKKQGYETVLPYTDMVLMEKPEGK